MISRRKFLKRIGVGAAAAAVAPLAFVSLDIAPMTAPAVPALAPATNFGALSSSAKLMWSRDLWNAARAQTFVSRMVGDGMPIDTTPRSDAQKLIDDLDWQHAQVRDSFAVMRGEMEAID